MHGGELIGSGRTADVFAIDGTWVLRRYRDGLDARPEAAVMAYLADRGYPVPGLREDAALPASDLVMRRLTGPTLLTALSEGRAGPEDAARLLAGLLRDLHAHPARRSPDPAHRILHLDLHPDNIVLTPEGPVVIDWSTAEEGPPALDWAMSALILAEVAVAPLPLAAGAHAGLAALLGAAHAPALPGAALATAHTRRAANPTLSPAEAARLTDAVKLVRALSPPRAASAPPRRSA